MYQYSYLVEQIEVLLSQFKCNIGTHPLTEDSLSFVTPANFPRAVTARGVKVQNLCARIWRFFQDRATVLRGTGIGISCLLKWMCWRKKL